MNFNGSSPCYAGIAQLVERNLAKVEVTSSNLVTRSKPSKINNLRFPFLFNPTTSGKVVVYLALISKSQLHLILGLLNRRWHDSTFASNLDQPIYQISVLLASENDYELSYLPLDDDRSENIGHRVSGYLSRLKPYLIDDSPARKRLSKIASIVLHKHIRGFKPDEFLHESIPSVDMFNE